MIASFFAPEWLVHPMTSMISWFYDMTGSFGVAIILLTIAVRVVILPLTIYQTKSMKKMQEVQPRIKELQAKHKDQPDKLNQEMMSLYKTEGVNPFTSCLPMVIQLPFLYALFAVLRDPNIHGAGSGFLWVANLHHTDVYLAVATAAAMFAQSFLSGMAADPTQRMMTYLIPLLFGYIAFQMPAGVCLYWVISTVFGLVQQAIYPGFPRFRGKTGPKGEAEAR